MSRRLLILLTQSPFDPSSGAAQSTRLIGETLALAGYQVKALATTACEGSFVDYRPTLPTVPITEDEAGLRFRHRDIDYTFLPVDPTRVKSLEADIGPLLDKSLQQTLADWQPDIVLTYGGNASDARRRQLCQTSGAKVIFALHNRAYRKLQLSSVDAFLSPTQYLRSQYDSCFPAPIHCLPPPLDSHRVVTHPHNPSLILFVNPEPAKGAILVAQLIKRLAQSHPEQPILVLGGRVPAEAIIQIGRDSGTDLSNCANLYALPATSEIGEILAETKIVLMPSVVHEAAGRVPLEAMLNGAVALVSNQAGLAEIAGDAAIKLPPPPATPGKAKKVPAAIVETWYRTIVKLLDDDSAWNARSQLCKIHASRYTLETLAPSYRQLFDGL